MSVAAARARMGRPFLNQIAELGWIGLGLAEADGGVGYSLAEEALFFRTIDAQGGRSHASGERPELGPVLARPVLLEPPPATFRVGLTPTAFNLDGTVLRGAFAEVTMVRIGREA